MDVTTVKLHKSTKTALDKLRGKKDSYDEVVNRLIVQAQNKNLKEELIQAYQSLGTEDLQLLEEWETASKEIE